MSGVIPQNPRHASQISRRRDALRISPRPHIVRCFDCRIWDRWSPIIPTWNASQGGICVLCEEVATQRHLEPVFTFGSIDELFAKKIAQVESWLYVIAVMSREADILEYGMQRPNAGVDGRVAMADMYGPLARGIPVSRETWETLTNQQKREHAIPVEDRPRFALPATLAAFYRTTTGTDKPRLLLQLARLKERSDEPLLRLWEQRHEQPSGIYTGVV